MHISRFHYWESVLSKKSQYAVVSVLLLVLSAPLWLVPSIFYTPWTWSVEIGDEFSVLVEYTSWSNLGLSAYPDQNMTIHSSQTYVRTTITSLPNITAGLNAESFRSQIMGHNKTVTTFQDGSNVTGTWAARINLLISETILPTGGWSKIQSFYATSRPTSFPMNVESTFFYTKLLHDSYLVSAGSGDFYHVSREWKSFVNLDTGVPMNITDSSSTIWGDGTRYGYRLTIWITEAL